MRGKNERPSRWTGVPEVSWRPAAALALGFGALFLLGWSGAGCNKETVAAPAGDGYGSVSAAMDNVPPLTAQDLPQELNLSATQKDQMKAALDRLQSQRQSRREAMKERAGGRRGFRGGWGGGRRGAVEEAAPLPGEPPMIGFIEDASKILTADQFTVLANYLAERRQSMRPKARPMADRFMQGIPKRAAQRLALTDEQQTSLRETLSAHAEQMRGVWDALEAGTMTAEQARDRAKEIRLDLKAKVQSTLTADQWARIEKFRDGMKGKMSDRHGDRMDENLDRRAEVTTRVLGLTDEESARVKQILESTIPARQQIHEQVKAGSLDPEDAAFDIWKIESDAAAQIRALLTPEQAQRFDALAKLLPRGPHGGMGPGMDLGPGMGMGMRRGMRMGRPGR